MSDTRIATEYLDNLFKRLSAGYISGDQQDPDLDPDCVDWAFAAECWLEVMKQTDRLKEVCRQHLKSICDEYEEKERHSIQRDYWRREYYKLRDHCERVTGTSPVDIGDKDG